MTVDYAPRFLTKNQYPYLVHLQILQYYVRNEGSKFQKFIPCGYLIKVLFLNLTSTKNINIKNKNYKALSDMYKLLNNSLYGKTLKKMPLSIGVVLLKS